MKQTNKVVTGEQARLVWLQTADVMGISPNTIHSYNIAISQWLDVSGFNRRPIVGANERDVDWFVNPTRSKIKKSTRLNRLSALQSLFRVCSAKAITQGDPACLVRINYARMTFSEKEPKKREPFNESEMLLLNKVTDPFWRAAILLSYTYGLRISDVAQLEWEQIKADEIVVWTDKRDKRITLWLNSAVRDCISKLPRLDSKFVFPEEREMIIDPGKRSVLSVYFVREIEKVGVTGKSFHCLRHTFASERKALGDSVDSIRAALGHSSSETTENYIHVK